MSLRRVVCLAVAAAALAAGEGHAIEMWTFYGDGSRIGLPSLEVPVEAYPGIPLRSDRIRARRRGQRPVPAIRNAAMPAAVTLREVPADSAAAAAPAAAAPVAPEPPEPPSLSRR